MLFYCFHGFLCLSSTVRRVCEGVAKRILWVQRSETANPQIYEVRKANEVYQGRSPPHRYTEMSEANFCISRLYPHLTADILLIWCYIRSLLQIYIPVSALFYLFSLSSTIFRVSKGLTIFPVDFLLT